MFRDSSSKLYVLYCGHLVEVDCEYPVVDIKYVNDQFHLLDDRDIYHVVRGGCNVNSLAVIAHLPTDKEQEGSLQFTLDNNRLTCVSDPTIMREYSIPDDPIDGVYDYRVCYHFIALLTIDKKIRLFIRRYDHLSANKLIKTFIKDAPDRISTLPLSINGREGKAGKPNRKIASGETIDIDGVEQIEMYGDHLFFVTIDGMWRIEVSDTLNVNDKLYYLSYIERSDQYNIQLNHLAPRSNMKNAAKRI